MKYLTIKKLYQRAHFILKYFEMLYIYIYIYIFVADTFKILIFLLIVRKLKAVND